MARRCLCAVIFGLAALVCLDCFAEAATNLAPMPQRIRGLGTNMFPAGPRPGIGTNQFSRPPASRPRTNVVAAPVVRTPVTNTPAPVSAPAPASSSAIVDTLRRWQQSPAFYPAVGFALVLVVLVLFRAFKGTEKAVEKKRAPSPVGRARMRKAGTKAVHSCNVLEVTTQARQVWQFDARGGSYVLSREQTCLDGEPLPSKLVGKDWRSFFQPRLNIAWLPSEQVFLRVAQLPKSDADETFSMVELQMEKLSPMPVAQVVWSFHSLSRADDNMQTVIVMIVARSVVEEFLGGLEAQGYLADRLELPLLDQLHSTAITEDGAWIYPEAIGGRNTGLVAWWYGGVLQNLDLLRIPATNPAASIKEQLMQMAWAGEMEGWLTSPPEWHLVADVAAAEWEPALRAGLEQPIEIVTPLATREVAALTARRSTQADSKINLMPPEFGERYHQQFIDRLWMRGLFAVAGLYLIGVAIYMVALGYSTIQTQAVENRVADLGPTYTNAIQLRDRYRVLKDRQELKFAGLDCWNTTARLLPENATLESFTFSEGKKVKLDGTAPADQIQSLLDFERELRHATVNDQPLFDVNKGDSLQFRAQGTTATWSLTLDLKRSEVQ
ncbi:MAG TPA: hypothetical protein VL361_10040 [Candidatus Limnocylindrales bacterium]|jgi:hypothetical protein|nr:hypothetical protein [Candidatus Limnocylindrales bacterium]